MIGAIIAAIFLTAYDFYPEADFLKMHATAYCLEGVTVTGKKVRKGIAATGRKDLLGKTAIVYQRLPGDEIGDLIGIYEIEDSGCASNVIDIWEPTLDDCQDLMDQVYADDCHGKVFVLIVNAEG